MPQPFVGEIWPITLEGSHVRLVPLLREHRDDLIAAARDGALWYTSVPEPERMAAEIKRRLALRASGSMAPFTVIERPSGRVVGMTTYIGIERLGARLDGVLRRHQRARDGTLRGTCVHSIVASGWPAVRTRLRWQLERPR